MPVFISMLRGVNVGGHNRIRMDALSEMYKALKLEDACSYVQSGNVIFRTKEKNPVGLAKKIQEEIRKKFGFAPQVMLRNSAEMRAVIAANPFPKQTATEPGKVLVTFLADEPPKDAQSTLDALSKEHPEELCLKGCELFIYFPNGAGQSKLPWSQVEKLFKVPGTARNWNTVVKLLALAEQLESA